MTGLRHSDYDSKSCYNQSEDTTMANILA